MAPDAPLYEGDEMGTWTRLLHRLTGHHWFWRHALRLWMCSDCLALR